MFVIPCKYSPDYSYVVNLVKEIRATHPVERIVVVDSDSTDKGYFGPVREQGAEIEDIANRNWMVGAYWHCYKRWPDEPFYFMMHDSMKVKANLDYLKKNPLTLLATFGRGINPSFDAWGDRIEKETTFGPYTPGGRGCYAIVFFCQNKVMKALYEAGVDRLLPSNKAETGYLEGAYGYFFERLGYDPMACSLFGDIIAQESPGGRSGPYPHDTSWQWPVEKFYAYHQGRVS